MLNGRRRSFRFTEFFPESGKDNFVGFRIVDLVPRTLSLSVQIFFTKKKGSLPLFGHQYQRKQSGRPIERRYYVNGLQHMATNALVDVMNIRNRTYTRLRTNNVARINGLLLQDVGIFKLSRVGCWGVFERSGLWCIF